MHTTSSSPSAWPALSPFPKKDADALVLCQGQIPCIFRACCYGLLLAHPQLWHLPNAPHDTPVLRSILTFWGYILLMTGILAAVDTDSPTFSLPLFIASVISFHCQMPHLMYHSHHWHICHTASLFIVVPQCPSTPIGAPKSPSFTTASMTVLNKCSRMMSMDIPSTS